MDKKEVKQINTTALAYLGDAVYEVAVRKFIMETGQHNADRLHQIAVRFVRAEGQAFAIRTLMPELTEEEQALVKEQETVRLLQNPRTPRLLHISGQLRLRHLQDIYI